MSKIRLHGSSSGYTEIAPVAASSNNTLTLPSDGTIISKDSNGAVGVTSVHATNVVATGTAKVGSGVTLSSDGDVFFTGISTGNGSGLTGINTPSFSAYVTGNPSISGNTNTIVVFNVEDHDTDGAYDTSTGVFTVPAGKAGKYHISAYGGIDDIDDQTYVRITVLKNDTAIPGFRAQSHASVNQRVETAGLSGTATLAVGDEIKVQIFTNDGVSTGMVIENETCRFSMFRLAI
jgi:hypothetical protein